MSFLLRCMVFLSIVYGAILRQQGLLPELVAPVAQEAAAAAPAAAGRQLVAGLGRACDGNRQACLVGAAKLGGLLVAAGGGAASGAHRARSRGAVAPGSPYMDR